MKKILINASNLHVGGGVQVAASFINELPFILDDYKSKHEISIIVSNIVYDNLSESAKNCNHYSIHVVNTYGFSFGKDLKEYFTQADIIFTIFGPLYYKLKNKVVVTGFAQAWIAYPNNIAYNELNIFQQFVNVIGYRIKEHYFKKSSLLIVEANHIKKALINKGYKSNDIMVVNNTVSSVFDDKACWRDIPYVKRDKFTLGFIGRSYNHKNLKILSCVNEILISKYKVECDFLFTLDNNEMEENKFIGLSNFHSIGSINTEQCPLFYQKIDALIFPSLLECFSASPVEAMKMEKLVIASELPFVTDICKSSARYFDPLSAESIALAIYSAINEPEKNQEMIINAKKLVDNLPTAKDRAEAYLDILLNIK
ncbi:TPA: glycosyltransferase [Photobacterium damselae]